MSERKAAIINVSKGLLGVSLTTLAAVGGATGNLWMAGAAAVPGAILASGLLDRLLKNKKEESLELPAPPWWSHGDKEWQAVCSDIEAHLSSMVEGAVLHLQQANEMPTAANLRQAFEAEVLQQLPSRVALQDRVLVAGYLTPLLLEKAAQVLQGSLKSLQEEALARMLGQVAVLLEDAHASPVPPPAVVSVQMVEGTVTPVPDAIVELERKRREAAYDAYMIYAQADEEEVLKIGENLKERGILPWFAAIDVEPGTVIRVEQEKQIVKVPSAAVFIGQRTLDKGQDLQIYSFIDQYVQRECKVIPVILPGTQTEPQLPIFLANFTRVDFRRQAPEPLGRLIWGITGKR